MRRPVVKGLGWSGVATIWRAVGEAAYPRTKRALDVLVAALGLENLGDAPEFKRVEVTSIGDDILETYAIRAML